MADRGAGAAADEWQRADALRRLRVACGQGRLTLDEMVRRTETVQRASGLADLRAAISDLPEPPGAFPDRPRRRAGRVIGGFLALTDRWPPVRLRPRTLAVAVVSEVVIDLRQATVSAWETVIDAVALAAEVRIIVPPGIRVQVDGSAAVIGRVDVSTPGAGTGAVPPERFTPALRVRAVAVFGAVRVEFRDRGQ